MIELTSLSLALRRVTANWVRASLSHLNWQTISLPDEAIVLESSMYPGSRLTRYLWELSLTYMVFSLCTLKLFRSQPGSYYNADSVFLWSRRCLLTSFLVILVLESWYVGCALQELGPVLPAWFSFSPVAQPDASLAMSGKFGECVGKKVNELLLGTPLHFQNDINVHTSKTWICICSFSPWFYQETLIIAPTPPQ